MMKEQPLTIIAPYEYGKENSRAIAHGIKMGDETAITEAARLLSTCIHEPTVLVPIPNSSGNAVTTLMLAKKIASIKSNVIVADVLYGDARQKAYDIKRSGKRVDRQDYNLRIKDRVQPRKSMLLDNCVDTGRTAFEAAKVTGIRTVLTYAVTTKRKVGPYKWIHSSSEAAYFKVGYKVVWLSKGDYYSPLCGDLLPLRRWLRAKDIEPFDKEAVSVKNRFVPYFLRHFHIHVGGPRRWFKNETSIAYRPGFHLYDKPQCLQFNTVSKGRRLKRLASGLYWAEVLYCNENSYQEQCNSRLYHTADGRCRDCVNHYMAGLNKLPTEGYYTYKESNSADANTCICTDRIYILRILNKQDIENILNNK